MVLFSGWIQDCQFQKLSFLLRTVCDSNHRPAVEVAHSTIRAAQNLETMRVRRVRTAAGCLQTENVNR